MPDSISLTTVSRDPDGSARTPGHSVNVGPTHSAEGVDLTLIRWMLSLTPLERLTVLQTTLDAIRKLRAAAAD